MSNHTVSVVIPVWNEWHHTKLCLDLLQATLGVRDEVIVVDNGSRDETASGLKKYSWVKVITNEENRGFGPACNQGAHAAKNDIVIFLNNDTAPTARWIEGLVRPFDDPTVGATGPRSDFVHGAQAVQVTELYFESMQEYRDKTREWREKHKGETSDVPFLIGFCLAVRRSDFLELGGFDEQFDVGGCEDTDLCLRIRKTGKRLLITHEVFIHHVGHATFNANDVDWLEKQNENKARLAKKHGMHLRANPDVPLLSACMIVKDEVDVLERCLASLQGLVDEVVIYDTGSTDGSIELARNLGAKVVEGYWDDDFGRARNAALDECSGEWILHIDADEVFEGRPHTVRDMLTLASATSLQVEILNVSEGGKNDVVHRPCRLFKREEFHWRGRLHEQVIGRDGVPRPLLVTAPDIRLVHYGYLPEVVAAKSKSDRNVRIAQMEAETDDEQDLVEKKANLARSLAAVGRNNEALDLCELVRPLPFWSPVVRRTLVRTALQSALELKRFDTVLDWCDEMEKVSTIQDNVHYFRGLALTGKDQWQEALIHLDRLDPDAMSDDEGIVYPAYTVYVHRAICASKLGDWERAADEIARAAADSTHNEPIWALVIEMHWMAKRSLDAIFTRISDAHLTAVLGQLVAAPVEAADYAMENLWEHGHARPKLLALAVRVAPTLDVSRALEWSNRLREVGMIDHCPLQAIASVHERPFVERLQALAVMHAAFQDARAIETLSDVANDIQIDEFTVALQALDEIEPALLMPFVIGTATSPERSLAMGRVLHELGADEEGIAIVMHGIELGPSVAVAEQAAEWLESVGRTTEAANARYSAH